MRLGRRKRVRDGLSILRARGGKRIGVRRAAQHDDRLDAHRPMEDMALGQVCDGACPLARGEVFKRLALQRDRALRRQEPHKRAHQRGLAGAVRADQRDELSRVQRQARPAHDLLCADAHRDVAGGKHAHDAAPSSKRRSRKIIDRKMGTPISAVTTPSLISTAEGPSRIAMSAASTSAAPANAAGSITRAGSEPTARRTRCGATSPTKPTAPETATAAPTPSATPMTIMMRVRPTSTPSDTAASSPKVSARKARAWLMSMIQLASMNGTATIR